MRRVETIASMPYGKMAAEGHTMHSQTDRFYRRRGLANLLRMGHCAPAVMQAILDIENRKEEWLVKLVAGLPGGIGNTGYECGGVTASMIHLGLTHGLSADPDGLPTVFRMGHAYCQRFMKCNHSLLCKDILGDRRLPLPCIKAVRHAPEFTIALGRSDNADYISEENRKAFYLLYSHLSANDFHCAHTVLRHLEHIIPVTQQLLDGTYGFMGGTAFHGLTCSAFTAGLMAIGLKMGEIENSHLRVIWMLATMAVGGNALADPMNKFNKIVNIGNRMSEWFYQEFGSTLCSDITRCRFSSANEAHRYVENGSVATCKTIAEAVAGYVEKIIKMK